jgi:hypothetical protein
VWTLSALGFLAMGMQARDRSFIILGAAVAGFSASAGVFNAIGKPEAARACVCGASLLTFPIGLIFLLAVRAAFKSPTGKV